VNSQGDVVAGRGNSDGGSSHREVFLTVCSIKPSLGYNLYCGKDADKLGRD